MKPPSDGWDRDERVALEPIEDDLAAVRARHSGDPSIALLRAAHADALPPDLQARVSDHLADSAWSRALVAGANDVEHVLDPESADRLFARIRFSAKPGRASARWWRVVAPMAVAAAAAIVAAVWIAGRGSHDAAPPSPAPPTQATLARNEPPSLQPPIQKPDVRLSVAALTWRGPANGASLVDDLAPALDAFRNSDYARAARMLEAVESRYPSVFDPPYYRGLSLLLLNDAAGAVPELRKAARLADDTFTADVARYLAVAEQRAGTPGPRR